MEKKNTGAGVAASPLWATLESFARQEIQTFIQRLLEQEVTDLLGRGKSCHRAVVDATAGYRNGYGKPRRLTLSSGTITLRRPRVRGLEQRFASRVLPLFQRRTREVGAVLPELYLHGLAQGDFTLALRGLLGDGAPLSASSIARLTAGWAAEYRAWRERSLADLELVYLWADGLYVKAGLEDTKAALLVVIGALSDGRKVVLAVEPGQRESTASWAEVLRSLKARGLPAPRLTVADGHLGLWGALAQVYPASAEQRCWNHRIVNILDAVPLKHQPEVRTALRALAYAATRAEAERLRTQFAKRYRACFPKAVERLAHDWDRLVAYYDFPEEHWRHLRTTNVVESPFDAVRLRTTAAKRFKKVENGSAMIWKLLLVAEQSFRRLNAPELLPAVYAGATYVDGVAVKVRPGRLAA